MWSEYFTLHETVFYIDEYKEEDTLLNGQCSISVQKHIKQAYSTMLYTGCKESGVGEPFQEAHLTLFTGAERF